MSAIEPISKADIFIGCACSKGFGTHFECLCMEPVRAIGETCKKCKAGHHEVIEQGDNHV